MDEILTTLATIAVNQYKINQDTIDILIESIGQDLFTQLSESCDDLTDALGENIDETLNVIIMALIVKLSQKGIKFNLNAHPDTYGIATSSSASTASTASSPSASTASSATASVKCTSTTAKGSPCKNNAIKNSDMCAVHSKSSSPKTPKSKTSSPVGDKTQCKGITAKKLQCKNMVHGDYCIKHKVD